ncbi:hypothetical protein GCM10022255_106740 [Dactylosporangium darangshiense]|uniref:Uncharacterized protein n=1 Tax=Dactylosporangium darangshiense TaxID=579108 RepID=A0ABP8DTM0_9ACTN
MAAAAAAACRRPEDPRAVAAPVAPRAVSSDRRVNGVRDMEMPPGEIGWRRAGARHLTLSTHIGRRQRIDAAQTALFDFIHQM